MSEAQNQWMWSMVRPWTACHLANTFDERSFSRLHTFDSPKSCCDYCAECLCATAASFSSLWNELRKKHTRLETWAGFHRFSISDSVSPSVETELSRVKPRLVRLALLLPPLIGIRQHERFSKTFDFSWIYASGNTNLSCHVTPIGNLLDRVQEVSHRLVFR